MIGNQTTTTFKASCHWWSINWLHRDIVLIVKLAKEVKNDRHFISLETCDFFKLPHPLKIDKLPGTSFIALCNFKSTISPYRATIQTSSCLSVADPISIESITVTVFKEASNAFSFSDATCFFDRKTYRSGMKLDFLFDIIVTLDN